MPPGAEMSASHAGFVDRVMYEVGPNLNANSTLNGIR